MAKALDPKELHSFLDFEDVPKLTTLDRSSLDPWGVCPWQAKALEDKRALITNTLMAAGEEVHAALSRTIQQWIDSDGVLNPVDLRNCLEIELRGSRPDVQPEALAACMASVWSFAQYLHTIHPQNILRFDGGEAYGKSGQLAVDFEHLGVRVTSELDLLCAGASIELLHELDYKSGWKFHTASSVKESFQFNLHAVLVFANYPDVRGLEVVVWNTRKNNRTYSVVFDRHKEPEFRARVLMAIQSRAQNLANPETWPTVEKCSICPVAAICPEPGEPIREVAANPAATLKQLIATEAKSAALSKMLTAYIDAGGTVQCDGHAFARRNKTDRQPNAQVVKVKAEPEESE